MTLLIQPPSGAPGQNCTHFCTANHQNTSTILFQAAHLVHQTDGSCRLVWWRAGFGTNGWRGKWWWLACESKAGVRGWTGSQRNAGNQTALVFYVSDRFNRQLALKMKYVFFLSWSVVEIEMVLNSSDQFTVIYLSELNWKFEECNGCGAELHLWIIFVIHESLLITFRSWVQQLFERAK